MSTLETHTEVKFCIVTCYVMSFGKALLCSWNLDSIGARRSEAPRCPVQISIKNISKVLQEVGGNLGFQNQQCSRRTARLNERRPAAMTDLLNTQRPPFHPTPSPPKRPLRRRHVSRLSTIAYARRHTTGRPQRMLQFSSWSSSWRPAQAYIISLGIQILLLLGSGA